MLTSVLRPLAAALLLTGLTLSPHAATAQTIELKTSHYLPSNHTVQKVLEDWSVELDRRSGGRLKLRVYPAAQLGPVQRQFDLARNGQADMAVGLTGATPGRYPLTELASLPFTAPTTGQTSEAMSRRMTELAPKYLTPEYAGLHLLWIGVAPLNTFFTARKKIDTLADLRGLKMRFQGEQHAKVLRALGATPLQVPPGEISDGMAKGVIDGAVFNYEAADSFGLATSTQHVMEPAFITATLVLAMNQAKYESLPADLRAILDETSGPDAAALLGKRWDLAQQKGREAMLAGHVAIDTLPPAEVEKLRTVLHPLVQEDVDVLTKAGKPAAALLADYRR